MGVELGVLRGLGGQGLLDGDLQGLLQRRARLGGGTERQGDGAVEVGCGQGQFGLQGLGPGGRERLDAGDDLALVVTDGGGLGQVAAHRGEVVLLKVGQQVGLAEQHATLVVGGRLHRELRGEQVLPEGDLPVDHVAVQVVQRPHLPQGEHRRAEHQGREDPHADEHLLLDA